MKENETETAPKNRRQNVSRRRDKEKARVSKLVDKAYKSFEKLIDSEEFSPTIAEYLKLVQLKQEAEQDTPKEIKVTWIDPTVTSDSEK